MARGLTAVSDRFRGAAPSLTSRIGATPGARDSTASIGAPAPGAATPGASGEIPAPGVEARRASIACATPGAAVSWASNRRRTPLEDVAGRIREACSSRVPIFAARNEPIENDLDRQPATAQRSASIPRESGDGETRRLKVAPAAWRRFLGGAS